MRLAGPDEPTPFKTDVPPRLVPARAAAGLSNATIRSDMAHLEQRQAWFGGPLWDVELESADADVYFGRVIVVSRLPARRSYACGVVDERTKPGT